VGFDLDHSRLNSATSGHMVEEGLVWPTGFDALALREFIDSTPDDPLTSREREVAGLIARGCSNRQIAQELVIAVSTAERHVANILSKLNLESRTQVAAWANERDAMQARPLDAIH
jgi:DNA-binding NarL/FixJ family response regulator